MPFLILAILFNLISENVHYIRSVLAQAYGTSQYWRVYPNFFITDGVKAMIDLYCASWLISDIFLLFHNERVRNEDFVVWKLALNGTSAVLTADDGNYNGLIREDIPLTDFPLSEGISLYWCDNVLYYQLNIERVR